MEITPFGLADASEELKRRSEAQCDPADFFNTRKVPGTDYINRALGVYVGIFGNTPDQSVYLTEVGDVNGAPTDGPFWVVLRTYGPSQDILDKKWKQPPYKPQQLAK